MEEYLRYMEENPMAGVINDEEDDVQYDSDGNPIAGERSKVPFTKLLFFSSCMKCENKCILCVCVSLCVAVCALGHIHVRMNL
jgi:ferredoxin